MTFRKAGISIIWSALLLLSLAARAQTDSSYLSLDSTVVAVEKRTVMLSPGESLRVDVGAIAKMPSILGSSDPVRFVRWLPSVQTGNEIDSGLHIQGCEHGHNVISMDGVPVYGANHILGIFSVFNPTHFGGMSYSTSAPLWNRIGGQIDLVPEASVPEKVTGNVSISPVHLQGTLRLRTSRRSTLGISARKDFLNLFYKPFLKIEGQPFNYGFGDYNLSWAWHPTASDDVRADAYWGSDNVFYEAAANALDISMKWWNALGALHWDHRGDVLSFSQVLYSTFYNLDLDMSHDTVRGLIPSYIRTFGYRFSGSLAGVSLQADAAWHEALPQQTNVMSGYLKPYDLQTVQSALETSLQAGYSLTLWDRLGLEASLKGIYYLSPERESFWGVSPYARASVNLYRGGIIDLRAGMQHQYLFQTGLTSLGFPIEFWFLAGKYSAPQKSAYASAAYRLPFASGRWELSTELYFRRLWNQVEYGGSLMDFLTSSYSLESVLLKGEGRNYGVNLMLQKTSGRLTGWAGYTLGRSLRYVGGEIYPSSHERIHEFNLVAAYDGGRWDAGGTFVAASGTPFTAPETFYLVGGQLIAKYGPHNGARVRPYVRLDVSFNWYWRKQERFTHGVNFSMYNVLGRRNDVTYLLMVGDDIPSEYNPYPYPVFAYRPQNYALRFMPSVGWFCKF